MDWKETLTDIFAAYLNQDSLEVAADAMVFVSHDDPGQHQRFTEAFERGVELAQHDDPTILGIINQGGGYRVSSGEAALELIECLHGIYVERYKAARTRTGDVDER
jgi:hypothetical protein